MQNNLLSYLHTLHNIDYKFYLNLFYQVELLAFKFPIYQKNNIYYNFLSCEKHFHVKLSISFSSIVLIIFSHEIPLRPIFVNRIFLNSFSLNSGAKSFNSLTIIPALPTGHYHFHRTGLIPDSIFASISKQYNPGNYHNIRLSIKCPFNFLQAFYSAGFYSTHCSNVPDTIVFYDPPLSRINLVHQ